MYASFPDSFRPTDEAARTRLIGGAIASVTEPADDIAGYWIHDS